MEIRPIRTEADYEAALAEVEVFFDMDSEPEPGTPDGDRFDVLATLIAAYEARHYPIAPRSGRGNQVPHGTGGTDAQGLGADDWRTQPRL